MKEIEWSSCPNPKAMLEFLGNRISDRHLKQFSVTCYEHIQEFLTEEAKAAVKAFAADIDNQIDSEALLNAVELLESEMFDPSSSGTIGGILNDYVLLLFSSSALETVQDALKAVDRVIPWTLDPNQNQPDTYETQCTAARQTHMAALADQLRNIVGNPFQTPTLSA